MDLLQALQLPVIVEIGNVRLSIPKMTLEDWGHFGEYLSAEKSKRLTEGMDEGRKFNFLNFYNILPIGLGDLQHASSSPSGISYILRYSFGKGVVVACREDDQSEWKPVDPPKDKEDIKKQRAERTKLAETIIAETPHGQLFELTQRIADLFIEPRSGEANDKTDDGKEETEEDQVDPQKPNESDE